MQHFLKYGETQAATRRRGGLRRLVGIRRSTFTDHDNTELKRIIRDKPYLYLDEIQKEMRDCCFGRVWHPSTLWRQLRRLGYSLKNAVIRARQACIEEQDRFKLRLAENVSNPRQYIVLDEVHKSANEALRGRGWSLRGQRLEMEAFFDRGFSKRYTLIAAADIDGFVSEACDLVEREHGRDDNDPTRGTVDIAKFERYVEDCLVPTFGRFEFSEPSNNRSLLSSNPCYRVESKQKMLLLQSRL